MNTKAVSLAAVLSVAFAAGSAHAENAAAAMAARYAQSAAAATTIEDAHKNMRQALNCLVGPGDEAYVATEPTTCTDGAIPKSDSLAAVSYRLAAQVAKTALALDSLGGAQFAARTAERMITTTEPEKPDGNTVATAAPTTITGTVGNVDINNQTLTIGNDTYYVRTPSNDVVAGLSTGARVEITYVTEDGRRIATAVRKVDAPAL